MIKKLAFCFASLALTTTAFAGTDITLRVGDHTFLPAGNEYNVSCISTHPACAVKASKVYLSDFDVYIGDDIVQRNFGSLDDALVTVKKLHDAGLCE